MARRAAIWRSFLLRQAFELLYGPLVLFHEPLGRAIFGPSWHGRRIDVLDAVAGAGTVLDAGSGAGHLMKEGDRRAFIMIGVEPSLAMRRLARRRGVTPLSGRAQDIPLPSDSIDAIVVTYPGNWIFDPLTWTEFARVLRSSGPVLVLLGGTVERGRGSAIRRAVIGLFYGTPENPQNDEFATALGHPRIPGNVERIADRWGSAFVWHGRRA